MVKHVVLYKLNDSSQTGRQKVIEMLMSMKGKIDELIDIEVGQDFLDSQRSFDIAIICLFKDRQALSDYQVHPLHLPVKAFMKTAVAFSHSVDFEV